jgi:hypothetical protein
MKQKKAIKVKIEYINEKLSKKPQFILGELIGHPKKLEKKIKIKRKVAHENFVQTFNLTNQKQIKSLSTV